MRPPKGSLESPPGGAGCVGRQGGPRPPPAASPRAGALIFLIKDLCGRTMRSFRMVWSRTEVKKSGLLAGYGAEPHI
jgi:hypothetical protein